MANPYISQQTQPSLAMQMVAPDLVTQQMQVARMQQLAQMLQEQGQQPSQTQMVSGWAVPVSPLERVARLGSTLFGAYANKKALENTASMQQQYANRLRDTALGVVPSPPTASAGVAPTPGVGQAQQTFPVGRVPGDMPAQAAPAAQPQMAPQSYVASEQAKLLQLMAAGELSPEYAKVLSANMTDAPEVKLARQIGIPLDQMRQLELASRMKAGTLEMRPNQTAILPDGRTLVGADFEGGMAGGYSPEGVPYVNPIQGAAGVRSLMKQAETEGVNRATLAPKDYLPVSPQGTYQPQTISSVIAGNAPQGTAAAPNAPFDPTATYGTPSKILDNLIQTESSGNPYAINKDTKAMGIGQFMPETLADMAKRGIHFNPFEPKQARAAMDMYLAQLTKDSGGDVRKALAKYGGFVTKDPTDYVNKVMSGVDLNAPAGKPAMAGEPIGLRKSIEGNVELANTRYSALASKNVNAPVMLDALDNVIKYAPGAITGAASDRRAYLNALGALIPGFESAKTVQEKTDLLTKNMNRIVGAGSNVPGATDALRNIVEASNPNTKMGTAAIIEASNQLKSIINMEIANQKLLEPLKFNNDFTGVLKTDAEFSRVADPKIWELEMLDPQGQAAMVGKMSPSAAKALLEKRAKLKAMGAL